ncbi:hypothetical protein E1264_03770 [Actinomadura sp. KC216]|uniref:hypothetical protein n=1 Tax=Actinomadura sp. KC216 TaxID=2530370 RepID=UPI00104E1D6D|nr:hypothetical protein [Actinomadura sp. KC216]TDB90934.1 hypothetical protein E1264_03770 [Actinomadura sp. KC216]
MTDNPFETDKPADPWSDGPAEQPAEETTPVEVSATVKAGSGYDAPWLVARGPSAKAIVAEMRTWFGEGGLIHATAETAKAFKKVTGNDRPAASGGAAPSQRSPQSSLPPGVEPKSCQHGEMVFRSGTNAKGTWKGFFCPTPKGTEGQCKPTFIK